MADNNDDEVLDLAELAKLKGTDEVKLAHAVKEIFSTANGKLLLKYLEGLCCANVSTIEELAIVDNKGNITSHIPSDPIRIAVNEGRRQVLLELLRIRDIDIKELLNPEPNGDSHDET